MFRDGVYTVLVTPFKEDGDVDYDSYRALIENQIDRCEDVRGFVLLGTTSESPTLTHAEKRDIVRFTFENVQHRRDIIVGVGGNNTMATLEFAKYCGEYSTALMVTVPNYNKPTQEGIYQHFCKICQDTKISNKPVIMYNIPSRCGVNMLPETVARIANDCPNVRAIKEASGSIDQAMRIKELCNIKIFSGDDALILPIMSIGGSGVISVASNVIPNEICKIVDYCLDNNFVEARNKYYSVSKLLKTLFSETNPIPVKYLLHKMELITSDTMRLPLCCMENQENMNNLVYNYFECISDLKHNFIYQE